MERFTIIEDLGIGYLKISGAYLGAGADDALLRVLENISAAGFMLLKYVIVDLYDVDSMTLADSDVARRAHWEKRLFAALEQKGEGALKTAADLKPIVITPGDENVRATYMERLRRQPSVGAPGMKTARGDIHATLQDALEALGLSDAASSILEKVESADHIPKYQ